MTHAGAAVENGGRNRYFTKIKENNIQEKKKSRIKRKEKILVDKEKRS